MIRKYLQEQFKKRISQSKVLLIYDSKDLYAETVRELKSKKVETILVDDGALSSWEDITKIWTDLSNSEKYLIIHVPFRAPRSEHEKVMDPFYNFGLAGEIFPSGPADEYKELCKQVFPDQIDRIEELFKEEVPSFVTIDNLGEGENWPKLQSLLNEDSDKEIIMAILLPDEDQKERLEQDHSWYKEYGQFIKSSLGITSDGRSLEAIQEQLWQYILFSEFVFDLPIELPTKLSKVPRAEESKRAFVFNICSEIRKQKYIEDDYVGQANKVDGTFSLSSTFAKEDNLGKITTFRFEDRTNFKQFSDQLINGKLTEAEKTLKSQKKNLWAEYDEERQTYWSIARHAYKLLSSTSRIDLQRLSSCTSPEDFFKFYHEKLWRIDQEQRYLEKAVTKAFVKDHHLDSIIKLVRGEYLKLVERINKDYQTAVKKVGWNFDKTLINAHFFNKKVKKLLKGQKKVAFYMVDAMRYEIAQEIKNKLVRNYEIEIEPVAAYLPTITKYAMAALLPNADTELTLSKVGNNIEPVIGERNIKGPMERLAVLQEELGDRVEMIKLSELRDIKELKKQTDLLVIPTTEIDAAGEVLANEAQESIDKTINGIIKSFAKLKELKIDIAILGADHGFMLLPEYEAGNAVAKPNGEWLIFKTRMLAGKGNSDDKMYSFSPDQLGSNAEVDSFVYLKNYATFKKGTTYFHEGLSLQENVVPCLQIQVSKPDQSPEIQVNISYKGKNTGAITTRRPSIEVACFGEGMFTDTINVKLEALHKDKVIGLPTSGTNVDPTSGWITITPGESLKIPLNMEEDFEGEFEVTASNPLTGIIYGQIKLETDYL